MFSLISLRFSSEWGKRFFGRYEKLAETINGRDVAKLAHVDCDKDKEFCESNGVQGNYSQIMESKLEHQN